MHVADAGLAGQVNELLLDDGFAIQMAELSQLTLALQAFTDSLLLLEAYPAGMAWLRNANGGERARTVLLARDEMLGSLHWHPYVAPHSALHLLPEKLRSRMERAAPLAVTGEQKPAGPVRGVLLVVDDDEAVRDYLCLRLESEGFQCASAGDGMEAVRKIEQVVPDVILLDLNMPGMDGMKFLSLARKQVASSFGVIVLTGEHGARLREQVTRYGAFTLMEKPVDFAKLLRMIEIQMEFRKTQNHLRGD